jgi:hypothetical protein
MTIAIAITPHPMILTTPAQPATRTIPATATASGARNRRAAARRQPSSAGSAGAAARRPRGSFRIATPTITIATSAASGKPSIGPPSRKPAMIGTAIAAGKAKSIQG